MIGALYTQSEYSMLNNVIFLDKLIAQAKAYNYAFLALSDHNNLYGAYKFSHLCDKAGIKPIIGLELSIDEEPFKDTRILLYATSTEGLSNLYKISSRVQENDKKPLELFELKPYLKGIHAVSSGVYSAIDQAISLENMVEARRIIKLYQGFFESFSIGLMVQTFSQEVKVAPVLIELANQLEVKVLPLHKASYLEDADKPVLNHLMKIDSESASLPEGDFRFLSQEELASSFEDYPYVFDNLEEFIQSIHVDFVMPKSSLPRYKEAEGNSKGYLARLCEIGLQKRIANKDVDKKPYLKRLRYELDVICAMHYEDYFLIVYDFVKYAKTHKILVGPGRGSAAGSLVSYTLGITNVDPIEYDLLFERFLNPERISMPDIDLDFPDNKRDDVIQYVKEKYGKEHVANIVTFGSFAARSALRDIARVMKVPTYVLDDVIKYVPLQGASLKDFLSDPAFLAMREDPMLDELLTTAAKIEGLPRHTSTHAAGIILSDEPLTNILPLQPGINGLYQSQFEASDLEKMGLLKIDFLGIKNLTMIDDMLTLIEKHEHLKIDINTIALDDALTYKLLSKGETNGVFQLESTGIKNVLEKLRPSNFEDIVAVLALYRPGPMDNIDEFVSRRRGMKYQDYHPLLAPILKNTYGIIVYQEQIMTIANTFAGYSLGEADLLRRAVSKKQYDVLKQERSRFIKKSTQKGYDQASAEAIYDVILKFADYGFNRSHSVAYAVVSYQMAYLKAHYPHIFLTVLLGGVIGSEKQVEKYLLEARRLGIDVLPPSINKSTDTFIIEGKNIRYPLLGIKNVGIQMVQKLLEIRESKPFSSYQDFKERTLGLVNSRIMEFLIDSNALDEFNKTKKAMVESMDKVALDFDQFIEIENRIQKTETEFEMDELIERERNALGFNLVQVPLLAYKDFIAKHQLITLDKVFDAGAPNPLRLIAYPKRVKEIKTKSKELMAFVLLSDGLYDAEAVVFPSHYQAIKTLLASKEMAVFLAEVQVRQNKHQLVIQNMVIIDRLKG